MPFGGKCEYQNFAACVAANEKRLGGRDAARRYCAVLMRRTEAHCAKRDTRASALGDAAEAAAETDDEFGLTDETGGV